MERRDFIRQMVIGLASCWGLARLSRPLKSWAAGPQLRLALLADAHLKSGAGRLPEARALARAVAEINALRLPPDLVFFAGDLAHRGHPDALDLGREILSDLSAPMWAVRGEGDLDCRGGAGWVQRFGSPSFSRAHHGVHFLGLDTARRKTPKGPAFELGPAQRRWLVHELAGLDPATPLVIVSHAPLARIFYPWQQWTSDAPAIAPLLARFRQVLCLYGHVHSAVDSGQWLVVSEKIPPGPPLTKERMTTGQLSTERGWFESPPLKKGDLGGFLGSWGNSNSVEAANKSTENRLHISLPATAWPLPIPIHGTPAVVRPGLGPRGCGWGLVTLSPVNVDFQPHLWQA